MSGMNKTKMDKTIEYEYESYAIEGIQHYLKTKTNKLFSSHKFNNNNVGFEGSHLYFKGKKYFYRFVVDLITNKYSIYFLEEGESVETLKEDITFDEAINVYSDHYNSQDRNETNRIESIRIYLQTHINTPFSTFYCKDLIYAFEGSRFTLQGMRYFFRFFVNLETDKYGLSLIQQGRLAKTLIEDSTLVETIKFYLNNYKDIVTMAKSVDKE
jgi:hypothetical protein